jgi:hypothetical protein
LASLLSAYGPAPRDAAQAQALRVACDAAAAARLAVPLAERRAYSLWKLRDGALVAHGAADWRCYAPAQPDNGP